MHIEHVEIGNFRKLKAVRIDFSEQKTVFVGANNSGKTSAMVALRRFLVEPSEFTVNDLTLSHWTEINASAAEWEAATTGNRPLLRGYRPQQYDYVFDYRTLDEIQRTRPRFGTH